MATDKVDSWDGFKLLVKFMVDWAIHSDPMRKEVSFELDYLKKKKRTWFGGENFRNRLTRSKNTWLVRKISPHFTDEENAIRNLDIYILNSGSQMFPIYIHPIPSFTVLERTPIRQHQTRVWSDSLVEVPEPGVILGKASEQLSPLSLNMVNISKAPERSLQDSDYDLPLICNCP